MALDVEHIVDGGVDREKALCRSRRLEVLHTSFALSHPEPRRGTGRGYCGAQAM